MSKKYYQKSLKFKILARIKQMSGIVVFRKEIENMGSPRQISRCVKDLVEMGELVKIGYGIYAKSYISENLKRPVILGGFDQACREALTKLGVRWEPGSAEQAYNSGQSTQVPARLIVKLKSRYRGRIGHGKRRLIVEKGVNNK